MRNRWPRRSGPACRSMNPWDMVINVGGGAADVAVISWAGWSQASIRVGGDALDDAIGRLSEELQPDHRERTARDQDQPRVGPLRNHRRGQEDRSPACADGYHQYGKRPRPCGNRSPASSMPSGRWWSRPPELVADIMNKDAIMTGRAR